MAFRKTVRDLDLGRVTIAKIGLVFQPDVTRERTFSLSMFAFSRPCANLLSVIEDNPL